MRKTPLNFLDQSGQGDARFFLDAGEAIGIKVAGDFRVDQITLGGRGDASGEPGSEQDSVGIVIFFRVKHGFCNFLVHTFALVLSSKTFDKLNVLG